MSDYATPLTRITMSAAELLTSAKRHIDPGECPDASANAIVGMLDLAMWELLAEYGRLQDRGDDADATRSLHKTQTLVEAARLTLDSTVKHPISTPRKHAAHRALQLVTAAQHTLHATQQIHQLKADEYDRA